MPEKSSEKNNEKHSEMEYLMDRVFDGRQEIFGRPYDAEREKFCQVHLGNRKLKNKRFVICDLLRIAYEYTDDPKMRKLILIITSQASAMQV